MPSSLSSNSSNHRRFSCFPLRRHHKARSAAELEYRFLQAPQGTVTLVQPTSQSSLPLSRLSSIPVAAPATTTAVLTPATTLVEPPPQLPPLPLLAPLPDPQLVVIPQISPLPQLDGAFCIPLHLLRRNSSSSLDRKQSTPRPPGLARSASSLGFLASQFVPPVIPVPSGLPARETATWPRGQFDYFARRDNAAEQLHPEDGYLEDKLKAKAERKRRSFRLPELDMVDQTTPRSRWQGAAMKVVGKHRFKMGLGGEIAVENFKVERLGYLEDGQIVQGPNSQFGGKVSFTAKKPLKGAKLSVTFRGYAEIRRREETFLQITKELFSGDLHANPHNFLFGFDFPHVNLPSSCDAPKVKYTFVANLTIAGDAANRGPDSTLRQYASSPAKVIFVPLVDPMLETPLVSRKQSLCKRSHGRKTPEPAPSAHTIDLTDYSTSAAPTIVAPKVQKPKLTLTTVDLSSATSTNSTPVIDRPHLSKLSSEIERTVQVMGDDDKTLGKMTVHLPASRFYPGDPVRFRVTIQVREGLALPMALSIRIIETRYLALEPGEKPKFPIEDVAADHDGWTREDEDNASFTMKPYGREVHRVVTKTKATIHGEQAEAIKNNAPQSSVIDKGHQVELDLMVNLLDFKSFIGDGFLPSSAIPFGDPSRDSGITTPVISAPSTSFTNGKAHRDTNEGRSSTTVSRSNSTSTRPATPATTASTANVTAQDLFFRVTHKLQVTAVSTIKDTIHKPTHLFSRHLPLTDDLDVTVPIIVGNTPANKIGRVSVPDVVVNHAESKDLTEVLRRKQEARRRAELEGKGKHREGTTPTPSFPRRSSNGSGSGTGSGESSRLGIAGRASMSSMLSNRSRSSSISITISEASETERDTLKTESTKEEWTQGMRFLTLREAKKWPAFVTDEDAAGGMDGAAGAKRENGFDIQGKGKGRMESVDGIGPV